LGGAAKKKRSKQTDCCSDVGEKKRSELERAGSSELRNKWEVGNLATQRGVTSLRKNAFWVTGKKKGEKRKLMQINMENLC